MSSPVSNGLPARTRRRRLAWGLAGLLAACALVDDAAWQLATQRIANAAPGVLADAARAGWQIDSQPGQRRGWPLAATVRFPAVTATRQLGGTTLRWTATAVEVTLSPFSPRTLLIEAPGQHTITLGPAPAIPIQAQIATVHVPLTGAASTFELRGVAFRLPDGPDLQIAHATGEIDALAASLTADGVAISPALRPPFHGPLALSGGLHLTAAFPNAATPGASALAWQHAGGQLEVPAMTLQWGPLNLSGSGSGGLDAQLQPQGRARLSVAGAPDVLAAAGQAGLLAPGPEAAARAVLSLLALATQGGKSPPQIPLQVTLSDRTLTVAQFPLLRLPLLDWNSN